MRSARRSPLLRRLCLLFALCFVWSFALAPCAVAAQTARKAPVHPARRPTRPASPAARLADAPYTTPARVTYPPTAAGRAAPPAFTPPPTLLNEVGHLLRPVPATQVAAWRRELRTTRTTPTRASRLHLWLGECALAQDQQPERARWHFRQAQHLTPRTDPAHGLAAYDGAMALFYEGAYQDAAGAFGGLLHPRTGSAGYDARNASLWRRHAAACAGYHAGHALLGVPEPPRLDPECGIASLAACLRALGRPYDRTTLRAACRVTGEGSNLTDLLAAGRKLAVSVRAVSADERGLRALPKPVVAFTEKDHFVAVVHADAGGVSYLCSDCGMWPGGRVDLTWRQWRALSPGVYAAVTVPGSVPDRALAAVTGAAGQAAPLRLSYGGSLSGLRLASRLRVLTAFAPLRNHVFRYGNTQWLGCGFGISGLHCYVQCCPKDSFSQAGSPSDPGTTGDGGLKAAAVGPSAGDPVNLATGEEEYTPAPDLTVYNPTGPSVSWRRIYNSLRPYSYATYQSDDFGTGWSQPFNVQFNGPPAMGTVLQIRQGRSYGPVNGVGHDAPASGLTWDVLLNGATVATSATPNGWAFTPSSYSGTLTPAASATVTTGYEVRWVAAYYPNPSQSFSSPFDVVPAAAVVQGGSASFTATGQDAPAAGLAWDVVQGGATVASSASPNGWSVSAGGSPVSLSISTQGPVPVGGFEARVRYSTYPSGTAYASATFTVYAPHAVYGGGSGSLIEPNGAVMSFTAPSAPTAASPVVVCSTPPGYPCRVEWDYAPGYYSGRFVVTWTDRTKWVSTPSAYYRSSGYLLGQVVDRNGNAINLQYYAAGGYFLLLTGIADSAGNPLLSISRDGSGTITSVSDRYGRSVYYGRDNGGGGLAQVSQVVPTGTGGALTTYNRYTYGYVNVNNPEGESGFYLLHTIRVPSPTGTGTGTATINYANGSFTVTSIVDGNGNTRTYSQVNADGSPADPGDFDVQTNYTHVAVTSAAGAAAYSYVAGYDGNMSETSRTDGATDAQGHYTHLLSQKAYSDANSPYRPTSVTDGNGRVAEMTWDVYGRMLTVTPPHNGTRTPATTTFTYQYPDAAHPNAFPLGELTQMQEGTKTPTSYAYFEPSGLLQTLTTPAPGTAGGTVSTSWTYDGLGNVLTETMPGNNAASAITTTFGYTADGGYSQPAAIGQPLTSTDNLGKVTHFRYDGRGNRTSVTDALGNEYDFTYNVADQPLTTADPATGQTGSGRAVQSAAYLYPGGPATGTQAYDEGSTSGPIRQITYAYGQENEPLGVSGSTEPVTYSYDSQYRLIGLTDGGGHRSTYFYNAAGYLYQTAYPGAASLRLTAPLAPGSPDTVTFPSYDNKGDLLTRIDGNGVTTTYTHSADPQSLLTLIHYAYPSGYAGTQIADVSLGYDQYGRRASMTDGTGTQSYAYDDLDLPLMHTTTYNGLPSEAITYAYWPDGSRQAMTTPAGTFSYAYDADGRMTGLTNPFESYPFTWAYRDNGWLASQQSSNVLLAAYAYNARGLVTDLNNHRTDDLPLSDFGGQTYSGVGDRLSVTASLPAAPAAYSGTTGYAYDYGQTANPALNRSQLTGEQSTRGGGYAQSHAYDGGAGTGPGNPTTLRGVGHAFNADNQDTQNTYDGDGSPTTYGGQTTAFDPEARETSLAGPGASGPALTCGYTGDGLRAWKQKPFPVLVDQPVGPVKGGQTDGGLTATLYGLTYFLYDGDEPVCELDSAGAVTAVNTFGAEGLVSRHTGAGSVFYTFDPSGSVAQRLDAGGGVVSSDRYDAFGRGQSTAGGPDVFGFGGQWGYYTDAETGLVLCTHRYYDPSAGRFLTRDPAGYGGGVNLYAYTQNNPVNRADPSGLQFIGEPIIPIEPEPIIPIEPTPLPVPPAKPLPILPPMPGPLPAPPATGDPTPDCGPTCQLVSGPSSKTCRYICISSTGEVTFVEEPRPGPGPCNPQPNKPPPDWPHPAPPGTPVPSPPGPPDYPDWCITHPDDCRPRV